MTGRPHTRSRPRRYSTPSRARATNATIYDTYGQPILSQTPEQYFGTNAQGLADVTDTKLGTLYSTLASTNTALTGRYLNVSGGWTTFTTPSTSYVGTSFPVSGNFAKIIENQIVGMNYHVLSGINACFNWRVDWGDEGYGNPTESIRSNNGLFPARFARVAIFPSATPTSPLFSGYLDNVGCVQVPNSVPNGPYTVWLVGRMQNGTTTTIVRDHKCATNELDPNCTCTSDDSYSWSLDGNTVSAANYPQVYGISFYVINGTMPSVVGYTPGFSSLVENVGAVYSQYLYGSNTGLLPNTTYLAYANQVCPGVDTSTDSAGRCEEACANTPASGALTRDNAAYFSFNYTNKTQAIQDLGSPNARLKFVVAHEMGHQIQAAALGALYNTTYDINTGNVPELLCRCDGLNPTGNELHCLQSSDEQGASQAEGFAQFSASNLWNDPGVSTCNFTYYKSFRDDQQFTHGPPYPTSCKTPVNTPKWTEDHCIHAGRASEWDWLEFHMSIARDPSAPVNQTDLASVYKRECLDETGLSNCSGANVEWGSGTANLDKAASETFGFNAPRYTTFHAAGSNYGVTR